MGASGAAVFGGWQVYQNLRQGRAWYENLVVEAGKGLIVGATLGLAAPALAGATAAELGVLTSTPAMIKASLLEAAVAQGRGGVSAAGRSLQSHDLRGGWLEGLAQGGNAAKNTHVAKGILEMILERGQTTFGSHPTFGKVIRVRLPDGSGAWWKENGEFIGYLERHTRK